MMNENDKMVLPGNLEQLFSEIKQHLKSISRFSLPVELMSKVVQIIDYYEKVGDRQIGTEEPLFRARIHGVDQRSGYSLSEMGAPPSSSAKAGRVNPQGLPYLYVASDPKTAIAEVRPWTKALISVGEFKVESPIRILDFTQRSSSDDVHRAAPAVFSAISEALFVHRHFGAPVHRDDEYSYLPMQFITDLVRQRGYKGIRFSSLQTSHGVNTVLFYPDEAVCIDVRVFGVGKIDYETEPLTLSAPILTVGRYEVEGSDW